MAGRRLIRNASAPVWRASSSEHRPRTGFETAAVAQPGSHSAEVLESSPSAVREQGAAGGLGPPVEASNNDGATCPNGAECAADGRQRAAGLGARNGPTSAAQIAGDHDRTLLTDVRTAPSSHGEVDLTVPIRNRHIARPGRRAATQRAER